MKINNARIKNVTVGLDDRDRLSARMTFESQCGCCDWSFILTNSADAQRLVILMNYTSTYNVEELDGQIVRMVEHDSFFRGFGHPIEDKFVPAFGKEVKEVTEVQLSEILKTK